MTFEAFSEQLLKMEETASRNEMTEMLATFFEELSVDEIKQACYLALGRIAPLYDRVEFNLADKMAIRAVSESYDVDVTEVRSLFKQDGDLGETARKIKMQNAKSKMTYQHANLSVLDVFDALMSIAKAGGEGSQERKVEGLAELLKQLDELSVKYVVRIVLGKLRLGFSDKTMLDALSVMQVGDKSKRKKIEQAYQLLPDVGEIARMVKVYDVEHLVDKVHVQVGIPVIPALAQRLKSADEMIKKMGEVAVEPKYDGTRVQIHISKSKVKNHSKLDDSEVFIKTFTRNLDENSHMFPELLEAVGQIKADSVILDGEAIGYDSETGALLPFQMTITRKRKHGIADAADKVPLKFFLFDLLYVDGQSLVQEPFEVRRARLEAVIEEGEVMVVDPVEVTEDPKRLRELHQDFLEQGLEGAVIKKMQGPYTPGRRGWNWVKFKEIEEAEGKLSDTLDVVVLGYYRGQGKRASFGIGAFLVGIFDDDRYVTIAKIGTGLTDVQWKTLKSRLEMHVVVQKPESYTVDEKLSCDVWVEPAVVVEVAADEITDSPTHSARVALRFPRLVKFRDDKGVEQATSLEEIRNIREVST